MEIFDCFVCANCYWNDRCGGAGDDAIDCENYTPIGVDAEMAYDESKLDEYAREARLDELEDVWAVRDGVYDDLDDVMDRE
jgi:hypothetical protein